MKKIFFLIFSVVIFLSFKSSEGVEIKWDFSKYKKITYEYHQIAMMESNPVTKDSIQMLANGTIELIVQSQNTAKIRLNITELTSYNLDSLGNKTKEPESFPPFSGDIMEIEENNMSKVQPQSENEILIKALFPILNKSLESNQKIEYPLYMYVNDMGKRMQYGGTNFLELNSKTENICNLELNYHLFESVEKNQVNDLEISIKGNSNVEYDVENKYFLKGKLTMSMKMGNEPDLLSMKHQINYKLISVE